MKIITIFGTSALVLAFGATASARGQHGDQDRQEHGRSEEHSDKHRGNDHERRNDQRSDQRHDQRQDQRHDQRQHGQPRAEHSRQDREHPAQAHGREERREAHGPAHRRPEAREIWQSHRAQHWEHEHHGWSERGGYRGYRIPDDRFRARFGHGHWFRVRSAPILVVGGYPRFQYGGFWFSVVDPWPEYWERTWYETDDVYVDYVNDGYYMYNRRHPGVGIAVNVSF
jgi:hypothetical protein